jgi:hypothetical protein
VQGRKKQTRSGGKEPEEEDNAEITRALITRTKLSWKWMTAYKEFTIRK